MKLYVALRNDELGIDKTRESLWDSLAKTIEEWAEVMGEVKAADDGGGYYTVVDYDPVNLIQEDLDLIQTCIARVMMVAAKHNIDMEEQLYEHNQKLKKRGWQGLEYLLYPVDNS
jgi:NTP pyrophosphatase (non-canonical NTP hydrolase)